MKQRIFLFLICLIHVLALFPKSADRFFSQYNFKFITENAGLPYSFVSDIFKDSRRVRLGCQMFSLSTAYFKSESSEGKSHQLLFSAQL